MHKKFYEAQDYIFVQSYEKYLTAKFNLLRASIGSPKMLSIIKLEFQSGPNEIFSNQDLITWNKWVKKMNTMM